MPGAIRGVKVVAPDTVEVSLSRPNPSFLHSLVNPFFSLVPIEEMNADYVSWKRAPVGAGPYRVVSGFSGGKVVLEKTAAVPRVPTSVRDLVVGTVCGRPKRGGGRRFRRRECRRCRRPAEAGGRRNIVCRATAGRRSG